MQEQKITQDQAKEIALLSMEDPSFFCRTFLPNWFPKPMPWIHRGMLAILTKQVDWLLKFGEENWPFAQGMWTHEQLESIVKYFVWRSDPTDPNSPLLPLFQADRSADGTICALHLSYSNRMLFIMPRGISKTTLVNAHELREIAQHDAQFLVYLSETATHAELQLETVKRELETNSLLRAVYGNKKPERTDPERWSQKWIETTDGIAIAAKGRGGQVRGINHRSNRPSEIIFDDVEDKESVRTKEQRDKSTTWLKADVEQALPQIAGKVVGRLIGLGTVLHHDSLLLRLSRDPEWITVRFGSVLPDRSTAEPKEEDMVWAEYMTAKNYRAKRQSFIRVGLASQFAMEYLSSTQYAGEGAKFAGPFKYKEMDYKEFPGRAIAIDPAISAKKDSDFCAFAVVGMTNQGLIHVLDVFMQRGMTPREQIDKYFEMHFTWNCTRHGVESVAYQRALIHLLKEEMFRRGKVMGSTAYFEIEPILHGKTSKRERVEGVLAPRYAAGYVTHQRCFPDLEEQFLDWPNGKLDGPDVVAMAVTLLDPFAAFAYDPENEAEDKLSKDTMEPLAISWSAP